MRLLEWNTPFEGWFAPYVVVARDGAAVTYRGPVVKRGDPSADESFKLAAGRWPLAAGRWPLAAGAAPRSIWRCRSI